MENDTIDKKAKLLLRGKKLGATALVAGGLVAGSVGVAAAATGSSSGSSSSSSTSSGSSATTPPAWHAGRGPGGPGGFRGPGGPGGPGGGTVTAVSPTSLTVSRPDGTSVTYTLSSSTKYQQGRTATTFSALGVGDHVAVRTATSSSSSTTSAVATEVDIIPPRIGGVVQSVSTSGSSTTIVVADAQGFWRTIVTSASTTYRQNGSTVTSPTITAGEHISASGSIDANHTTLDATNVIIGRPTPPSANGSGSSNGSSGTTSA